MKTIQILAMMLVALVGMTACSNDDDEKKPPLIPDSITKEYSGKNSVMVGEGASIMGPYEADIICTVTTHAGGTISITYPEYQLTLPVMGDMTLGAYTISNIPYDEEKGAFYLETKGLTEHLKIGTGIDRDYNFTEGSFIQVEKSETGIKVTNNFGLVNPETGKTMPFPIQTTFEGTVTK